jgi:hypothetical protein
MNTFLGPMPAAQHYLFRRWTNMLYDAKHLGVYSEWTRGEYWEFVDYVETTCGLPPTKQHKLIRIDPDKGWRYKNMKWATATEAGLYQRSSRIYKIGRETNNIMGWARKYNRNPYTVYGRIAAGQTIKQALELV